jgi:hypothetical protein
MREQHSVAPPLSPLHRMDLGTAVSGTAAAPVRRKEQAASVPGRTAMRADGKREPRWRTNELEDKRRLRSSTLRRSLRCETRRVQLARWLFHHPRRTPRPQCARREDSCAKGRRCTCATAMTVARPAPAPATTTRGRVGTSGPAPSSAGRRLHPLAAGTTAAPGAFLWLAYHPAATNRPVVHSQQHGGLPDGNP